MPRSDHEICTSAHHRSTITVPDNLSGYFISSLVQDRPTTIIIAPSASSPFPHPHSHHSMAPLPTCSAMLRLTKGPTYLLLYAKILTPVSNNTANCEFRGADRRWSANAAQVAYNQSEGCTHVVSGSSHQYDTISLLMIHPSPSEDNSKIILSPPL